MKISELFYSVQGEGTLIGVPSVFVRTSGCNLRCTWCDTPYTSWQPEGENRTVEEIVSEVEQYGAKHVVVTGGEPMIAPEIPALTQRLRSLKYHITIETAGTVLADVACDLMSLSPKLANSTPYERDSGRWAVRHENLRYQPEVLRRLMTGFMYQLKFVVESEKDLAEIDRIVRECAADPQRVVLMPEGTDRDVLRDRALWLVDICKRTGYRLSPRLHVDLWGPKRGV